MRREGKLYVKRKGGAAVSATPPLSVFINRLFCTRSTASSASSRLPTAITSFLFYLVTNSSVEYTNPKFLYNDRFMVYW